MTTVAGQGLDGLRSRFSGRVITAADGEYDQARSVWNGAIDARPTVIARCAGAGDVAMAVGFAQEAGLEISVRGGAHNFGVVTEFEFQLYPVGPLAQLGMFFWDLDDGEAALAVAQQITADLPPQMGAVIAGLNAPPAPFVPEQYRFRPGLALIVAAFGADADHARLAGEICSALPPLFEFITPIPYTALQQILDESAPWGILAYEKALYLDALSAEVISVITAQMARKRSPMSLMLAFPMGGAFSQVPDEATAFGGSRAPSVIVNATAIAPEPGLLAADRDWARQLWQDLLPHAPGIGSYVNLMTDYEADRVKASYGPAKYQRLAQVKAAYDPDNVFHRNPNVTPAG
jgi:FAD/FMN-containing dehydrogenase